MSGIFSEIDNVAAGNISSAIRAATASSLFNTRAELLKENSVITALTNMTGQNSDRQKEEIIGKFISLVDANSGNVFYVIALGQAIKDVGVNTARFGIFDINKDLILSTQKIYAIIQRNPQNNSFRILRIQYITE